MLTLSHSIRRIRPRGSAHGPSRSREYSQTKNNFAKGATRNVLLMDANGILYRRKEKKIAALSRFLEDTGRYDPQTVNHHTLSFGAEALEPMQEEANKGIITHEQYFLALLTTLSINPVDFPGAMQAIEGACYNIALFPDVETSLRTLKFQHGVKLGIVTDSMSPTSQKLQWMQRAGLDTSLFDVIINSCEMGATKPEHRLYLAALDKLQATPADAAFLGHRSSELDGAKELGFATLVMNPDRDILESSGAKLVQYDFFVPSWKQIPNVPFWPRLSEGAI